MKNFSARYWRLGIILVTVSSGHNIYSMAIRKMQMHHEVPRERNSDVNTAYECRYLKNLTQKNIAPENTVFAFDLHEVLFNRSHSMMAWGGFKLFCKSFFYMLFHPLFLFRLISISREPMVCEGMYVKLSEEYPYAKKWEADVFEIANGCCYPEMPMINLLKILKQKGFKIFLLSNIGADAFEDFRSRFNCIEGLFDGFYTPSRKNNYSYKPILGFYEGFKNYLSSLGLHDKQILFIDDIEKNIVAATQVGIAGIHFIGLESLCWTLNTLGIQVSASCCNQIV